MEFNFIKHSELTEGLLLKIIEIKQHHWNYPLENQKKWIEENLKSDDFHLILFDSSGLIGYLTLVDLELQIDSSSKNYYGIGSVCVHGEMKGKQLGLLLMKLVDYFLNVKKTPGILLCKSELVDFYKKCGWKLYNGKVRIGNVFFEHYLLSTNTIMNEQIDVPFSF
ncbi:GNAT family N-acetyltransferase [Chryseobacterium defluvii]|uniref:Acetyltransferase (GNAT) family protein n=1 Tax=Chryseobacterium defluvii TaxID=160396 RepID=A0A495SM58_9FLAO|nr:GNAT family N-acetyltransferase [Chryseobacterium defluvii]RKT01338.1 acetyltransferase (GNAT) family protein [Chryseobacterium defluvii]